MNKSTLYVHRVKHPNQVVLVRVVTRIKQQRIVVEDFHLVHPWVDLHLELLRARRLLLHQLQLKRVDLRLEHLVVVPILLQHQQPRLVQVDFHLVVFLPRNHHRKNLQQPREVVLVVSNLVLQILELNHRLKKTKKNHPSFHLAHLRPQKLNHFHSELHSVVLMRTVVRMMMITKSAVELPELVVGFHLERQVLLLQLQIKQMIRKKDYPLEQQSQVRKRRKQRQPQQHLRFPLELVLLPRTQLHHLRRHRHLNLAAILLNR
mmetsp:Transcript_14260/g.20065  ORF Transcript_14260/g.20065 Transcript_14260/m.20065 type:complete len:262 (+) Transcript_14260:1079-1864(+)